MRRLRLRRLRGERGAVMVEFALIAVPFLLMLFGTIEVGLVFWGNYELENATEQAAREIRTGQVAAANMRRGAFKALVCSRVSLLAQCEARLKVDVRSFTSFAEMQRAVVEPSTDSDGELLNDGPWGPGGPRSLVLVTTFYEWPLITPMTAASLSNMGSGNRLLRASAAFQNEPWPG
ncbi:MULTISPECIES: TadE/TadG family type IV pilus assembly protein [Rhodomicrobium]|uniref:TadE/TadG family type IV pilus assembly protein n=1 Tax=Rhodomicrobium TaxID=1068 RepID=UPI001483B7E4|nr:MULTISPECIES: TadE/TadG family type IV pilus assembly protein [Rhodomicrobium]